MDFLIAQNPELMETWPIEKRAEINGGLPDRLSIKQIAKLCFPQDSKRQNALISTLIKLCKESKIDYYGDINGWEWGGNEGSYIVNPYESVKGVQVDMGSPMRTAVYNKWRAAPADCLIHKDGFKRYLEHVAQWPIEGLLANWWANKAENVLEPKVEVLVNDENPRNERGYTAWLRETWVNENSPTGGPFFKALKNYVNKDKSPITEWWSYSKDGPGLKIRTETTEIELPKLQIQKIVSGFRGGSQEEKNLSSKN